MNHLTRHAVILAAVTVLAGFAGAQQIHRNGDTVTIEPVAVPEALRNPVSPEEEAAFRERTNQILGAMTRDQTGKFNKVDSRTFFESEKWSYPSAFAHILAGNETEGVKVLQAEDADAKRWHQHTDGIDFFPAFTLKGQMRKYYFFGKHLSPEYRERMKTGAAKWTKTDPRTTPHPVYQKFNPKIEGWTPERFGNKQVDARNTDNLRAMRDIAIYLFAEETGNTETMKAARKDIEWYVRSLYTVGMGEWDSDTYHCHTVAPYLCLYDFAKDPEMRALGKAALDHLFTAAALKYHNGTFSGTSKRDYANGYQPMGSPFGKFYPLYFGNAYDIKRATEKDITHSMTSAYRPPPAVLALARKQFDRPVEVLATHPSYEHWKEGASERPRTFETIFIGRTFQLSSAANESAENDLGPFRLTIAHPERGAEAVVISSRPKLNEKYPGDQIAQYRNLLIWLRPTDNANPFTFQVPTAMKLETEDGIWFGRFGETYLAFRPINLGAPAPLQQDAKAAEAFAKSYRFASLLGAKPSGAYSGFALEIGEAPTTFEQFRADVRARGKLELTRLDQGIVKITGADGSSLELHHNNANDLPGVVRNGELFDHADPKNWALWRTVGDRPLISLGWKQGTLRVEAGGHVFESVLADGKFTFKNR